MITLKNILLVAGGGAIGASARFILSVYIKHNSFPLNTLLINLFGCFLAGIITALLIRSGNSESYMTLFFITGICGGFTTFSAFSLENMKLLMNGNMMIAMVYISLSVIGGILAAFSGFKLVNIIS